jgi:hypothetical protein
MKISLHQPGRQTTVPSHRLTSDRSADEVRQHILVEICSFGLNCSQTSEACDEMAFRDDKFWTWFELDWEDEV